MEGKVKWYSKDKGYGFITGLDDIDRYFNESSIEGGETPNAGDWVGFDEKQGNKGPHAIAVKILRRSASPADDDDRVVCGNCGKKMTPLVVFEVNWRGRKQPYHSVCPYCGSKYKSFETGCFIASAVYDGHHSEEVTALRRFRDEQLLKSAFGECLAGAYYRVSPSLAVFIERHPRLKRPLRSLLGVVVQRIRAGRKN